MKPYSKRRGIISLSVFVLLFAFIAVMVLNGIGHENVGAWYQFGKGLDLEGGVSITYQVVGDVSSEDIDDTVMKLQDRVEGFSTESRVYREGTNRITVEIPGRDDPSEVLAELGNPGTLVFCTDTSDVEGSTRLTGADIENAVAGNDPEDASKYVVQLTLKAEGISKFSEVTKELAGTSKPLYILFDGEPVSSPVVNEQITSPTCVIEGITDRDTAIRIASYIRIGALPVELEEISSQVVGATLGTNAINTSMLAMIIGLSIICVLMIVIFRMPGFASALALTFYTALIFAILSLFNSEITLTLPGIAGIILSIGMAVDANVIIFSRIREEIGLGSGTQTAINEGFKKALSAIVDGNVTTLIAAVVLWILGTGPIKGFAITLAIGIVLSMFTALVVTKILIKSFYALGLKNQKWYGVKKPAKAKNFVSRRGIFLAVSGAAVLIGAVFMVIHGTQKDSYPLNYSLDFVGGTSITVNFDEYQDGATLESEVKPILAEAIGDEDIVLTPSYDTNNTDVTIKTKVLTEEQREALYKALEEHYQIPTQDIQYQSFSATVSSEMARSAIIAIITAAVAMLLYIWLRFRDFRFATASVLALVHDVLVVLAGYAVFRWTVGNTFIACMLTLVGYSINATIVVFDRIRENQKILGAGADVKEVVNLSITQTLGRSVYTSLTTLIMVAVLFIFGATSIKDFALPLMVGLVVGCYSSVCLAGSVWYILKTKIVSKKTNVAAKAKK